MELIITQIAKNFINNLTKVISEDRKISEIEGKVAQEIAKCAAEVKIVS